MAKKKTATKGTKKTSTASRKKGPVKKSATGSKPTKRTTTKQPATKKPAAKSAGGQKPAKKMSGLDAAAKILADAGEPLRCREIVDRMLDQKLWTTKGATPHATIYAALIREIASKGSESRFKKTGRGLFTIADAK